MTIHEMARKSAVCLSLALALSLGAPSGYAASAKSLDKQAKKVASKLAKYPKGAFLHFHFRDGSESSGKLNKLADNSFSITNSDSNSDETHRYSDVTRIEKEKTYIGKDSESRHRLHMPF